MLKKYLINNEHSKDDKKYKIMKRKVNKNKLPGTNSVVIPENSSTYDNRKANMSQISNKSYLDKSNLISTPRSRISTKLKTLHSKKPDISSRLVILRLKIIGFIKNLSIHQSIN